MIPGIKNLMFAILLLLLATTAQAVDHSSYIEDLATEFDPEHPSKICLQCHEEEAEEVFNSPHYQWAGEAEDILNKEAVIHGKKYAYNDFCGAVFYEGKISINFIGKVVNEEGKVIATGCSACHPGYGLIPQSEMTEDQLDNIDCLVCHVANYSRMKDLDVVKKGEVLIRVAKNSDELLEKMKTVRKPTKYECVRCHVYAGGGELFKRDFEPFYANPECPCDYHMAILDFECTSCHVAKNHRIAGRGLDEWVKELDVELDCTNCHIEGKAHQGVEDSEIAEVLERHTKTVHCTVCHIPRIAKVLPTDIYRDWREAVYEEERGKYEPLMSRISNVVPTYAWWNGKDRIAYIYPEPVEGDEIIFFAPVGSKDDPDSKIYPFKFHQAVVPFDTERKIPIPIKVGLVFKTGNTTKAFMIGAKQSGLNYTGTFITMKRYMSIHHGVVPAEDALRCEDCHFYGKRLDWKALGYTGDPILTGESRFKAAAITTYPTKTTPKSPERTPGFELIAAIAGIAATLYALRRNGE
jgi:hypothetical protein